MNCCRRRFALLCWLIRPMLQRRRRLQKPSRKSLPDLVLNWFFSAPARSMRFPGPRSSRTAVQGRRHRRAARHRPRPACSTRRASTSRPTRPERRSARRRSRRSAQGGRSTPTPSIRHPRRFRGPGRVTCRRLQHSPLNVLDGALARRREGHLHQTRAVKWRLGYPGCLPDQTPRGRFASSANATASAQRRLGGGNERRSSSRVVGNGPRGPVAVHSPRNVPDRIRDIDDRSPAFVTRIPGTFPDHPHQVKSRRRRSESVRAFR